MARLVAAALASIAAVACASVVDQALLLPTSVDDTLKGVQGHLDNAADRLDSARTEMASLAKRIRAGTKETTDDAASTVQVVEERERRTLAMQVELDQSQIDASFESTVMHELEAAERLVQRIQMKRAGLSAGADEKLVAAIDAALSAAWTARNMSKDTLALSRSKPEAARDAGPAKKRAKDASLEAVGVSQDLREATDLHLTSVSEATGVAEKISATVLASGGVVEHVRAARASAAEALKAHQAATDVAVAKLSAAAALQPEAESALQSVQAADKVAQEIRDAESAVKMIKVAKDKAKEAQALSDAAEATAKASREAATAFDLDA